MECWREIFHLLDHSQNAKPEPGFRNLVGISHIIDRKSCTWTIISCFPELLELHLKHSVTTSVWDANITGGNWNRLHGYAHGCFELLIRHFLNLIFILICNFVITIFVQRQYIALFSHISCVHILLFAQLMDLLSLNF